MAAQRGWVNGIKMAIRTDRPGADRPGPEGPEKYAPPDRRTPEKLGDIDQAAVNTFEGEIRGLVRRNMEVPPRQRSEADPAGNPALENMNSLIWGISGGAMEEIDRVIHELESVREMLRKEGERVNREVAGYASLGHASTTAMKIISESLAQWKRPPNK